MSKITIIKGDNNIEIDNNTSILKKYKVMVDIQYINKLIEAKIPFTTFGEDYYICKRGKKQKKFDTEQVQQIKKDLLENKISIRKASEKYKCSTKTIQQIKNNTY